MTQLLVILGLTLVVAYLWSAVRAKEIAIKVGANKCAQEGVQFLDETVEQRKVRFTLDPKKNPAWYREYNFEFATTGEFRYAGKIVMYGQRVYSISMDPYPERPGIGIDSEQY
jgi:hypothetical protein